MRGVGHAKRRPIEDFRLEDVIRQEALGGLLKHYELRAA
jgi:hypothetical protein